MTAVIATVVAVVLIALLWLISNYNRFARLRQHLRESWSDIDVELKRRYELIPNLVQTVKGYASHERQVLEEVTRLRGQAVASQGSPATQATAETALMLGLKKLFAVIEAYPKLKADTNFLSLQKELALTEDRIAAARRFYNGNVREMNQLCHSVPTNVLASIFGFKEQDFFELASDAERIVPQMGF